jgi:hypothetical protein
MYSQNPTIEQHPKRAQYAGETGDYETIQLPVSGQPVSFLSLSISNDVPNLITL